jgi:uncharacterized protein (DUF2141 family)
VLHAGQAIHPRPIFHHPVDCHLRRLRIRHSSAYRLFHYPKEDKMTTKQSTWNSQSLIRWILIIGVACLVYVIGIAHESIWFDEAFSYMMASHSPGQILGLMTTADNHPPLYYLLLSAVMSIFGNSVWALRLISVLGAIGLVGLGAGPVRRLFGNTAALIYAGVVLFTPVVLIYAHEARMYSLASFCVTASVLYGYLAVKTNRRSDWVAFGLASLAAAYLHYYGLMAAFFMHLLIFLWLLFKKRETLKSYLVTGAAVVVGYLPWLVFFYQQVTMVGKGFWIPAVTWQGILNAMIQPFAYKDASPPSVPAMTVVLVFSAILIVVGLVLAKLKAGDEWAFGLLVLAVFVCSFISPILISLVSNPIFYARYVTVLDGLFLLLVSLGISLLPRKWLQVAAFGLFALANVSTMRDVYVEYFNPPVNQAADYLKDKIQPGDPIVTSELLSMGPAFYYLPQAVHYNTKSIAGDLVEQQLKIPFSSVHRDQDVDTLLSTHPPFFWYVTANNGLAKSIGAILHGEEGWEVSGEPVTFAGPFSSAGVKVTKVVYSGRVAAPTFGKLNLHITGLRPPGNLLIALFNDAGNYPIQPSSVAYIPFSTTETTYTFDGMFFGDYVIYVFHDENNNKSPDRDSEAGLFTEGYGWANMDKVDLRTAEAVRVGTSFDDIKYTFDEDGKTAEIKILGS